PDPYAGNAYAQAMYDPNSAAATPGAENLFAATTMPPARYYADPGAAAAAAAAGYYSDPAAAAAAGYYADPAAAAEYYQQYSAAYYAAMQQQGVAQMQPMPPGDASYPAASAEQVPQNYGQVAAPVSAATSSATVLCARDESSQKELSNPFNETAMDGRHMSVMTDVTDDNDGAVNDFPESRRKQHESIFTTYNGGDEDDA
ncbi:hypothetical protein HK405_013067, partial [Cladochytrium tenue]